MPLIWSAVTRGPTVLAECGEDNRAGEVLRLAQKILRKKATPGWESERVGSLRALKFHVYSTGHAALPSTGTGSSSGGSGPVMWSICCVYDSEFPELQARGFLEKLALMSEPLRSTPAWLHGGTLAAQDTFAATLLQRMEQASSGGRLAMVSSKVEEVRSIMADNIELLLHRGDQLDALDDKATNMNRMAQAFRRRARDAKRFQLWQQAKFGLVVGTAVTVGVAIVVVPPVLAIAL